MKVSGFVQERGACTGYRIGQPLQKIKKLGLADVHLIGPADPDTHKAINESDVVFLGRAADQKALEMIRRLKGMGKRVVFDLDDSMFEVSPFSPHYRTLGIMPVDFEVPGNKWDGWRDGKDGFDLKTNRHVRRSFIEILREVDCITCTTPPLQRLYSRFNDNVRMIPNAIDFDLWRDWGVKKQDGKVRVIYPAGSNHQEDWLFIRPVLKRLQDEVKGWTLVLMGVDWKGQWGDLDISRIETTPWVDFEAYPLLMSLAGANIGVCPIAQIPFNDCRSSVKWAEYSAVGAATVATDYGPYRRDCEDGKTAVLVKTADEWFESLRSLIMDRDRQAILAEQAQRKVRRDFNLDFTADLWMSAFTEASCP